MREFSQRVFLSQIKRFQTLQNHTEGIQHFWILSKALNQGQTNVFSQKIIFFNSQKIRILISLLYRLLSLETNYSTPSGCTCKTAKTVEAMVRRKHQIRKKCVFPTSQHRDSLKIFVFTHTIVKDVPLVFSTLSNQYTFSGLGSL